MAKSSDTKDEDLILLTPNNVALTAPSSLSELYDRMSEKAALLLVKTVDQAESDLFTTVGLYLNDEHVPGRACKSNGVPLEDLLGHVLYNLSMRPGRAFFLNGVCLYPGYFESEEVAQQQFDSKGYGDIKYTRDTQPYV